MHKSNQVLSTPWDISMLSEGVKITPSDIISSRLWSVYFFDFGGSMLPLPFLTSQDIAGTKALVKSRLSALEIVKIRELYNKK